jgi:hypothetical protein
MGWLPSSIIPREARFAHVASAFRLAEIYVPFVCRTSARWRFRLAPRGEIRIADIKLEPYRKFLDLWNAHPAWNYARLANRRTAAHAAHVRAGRSPSWRGPQRTRDPESAAIRSAT